MTGTPRFGAETMTKTLQQSISRELDSPRLLNPRVPRDLETMCLKCLNKEPHRRYRSAEALAEDLQHWLTDEPILARPIGRAAKSWRWCRRKPVLAGLATSTTVLLLAVAVGSPIALVQISRERNLAEQRRRQAEAGEKKARREATKSEQVAKFLKDMLRGVGPSVALGRDTTLMRELLDKTGERLGKDLTNQPEVEAELRFTMGNTYLDLGESAKAEALHREALAMRRKLLGSEHADVAASLYWLGYALWGQRKLAEAEIVHREALAIRKRLFGEVHPDVASSLSGLADVFLRQGTLAAAETLNRDALAMRRTLLGNENLDVAASLYNLAVVLGGEAKLGEAQALHREALTLQRKMLGNEHPALLWSLQSLGDVLSAQGKLAEAANSYREALAIGRKLLGNDDPAVAGSLHNLADVLRKEGNLAEAETSYREALRIRRKVFGDEHPSSVASRHHLIEVLRKEGKIPEAEAIFPEGARNPK